MEISMSMFRWEIFHGHGDHDSWGFIGPFVDREVLWRFVHRKFMILALSKLMLPLVLEYFLLFKKISRLWSYTSVFPQKRQIQMEKRIWSMKFLFKSSAVQLQRNVQTTGEKVLQTAHQPETWLSKSTRGRNRTDFVHLSWWICNHYNYFHYWTRVQLCQRHAT